MHLPRTILSIAAIVATAGAASAQILTILPAGHLPSGATNGGGMVVGDWGTQYFLWTPDNGSTGIGGVTAAGGAGGIVRIASDGSRVSGTAQNPGTGFNEVSRYNPATGVWTNLGGIGGESDGNVSSGWGISPNGQHIVGLGWVNAGRAHAVSWSEGGVLTDMGSTVPNRSSRANAVNADGSVIVGWQDAETGFRQAAVWNNGVQTLISNGSGEPLSEAGSVSNDGTWVAGGGGFATSNQAWRWSADGGVETLGALGVPGFNVTGAATGMSGDGSVIVGYERSFGPPTLGEGFFWSESAGMLAIDDYFASFGIMAPNGLRFSLPLGVSEDGLTFFGIGRDDSNFQVGWVVTVPTPGALALFAVAGLASTRRRR